MTKTLSRLTRAMLETTDDMYQGGLIDRAARDKITMRHLGDTGAPKIGSLTPDEIRTLREEAHMSQSVFGGYLNLTPGYISQLERGAKRPTGPALVLLNVIRRKGIAAIL